MYEILPFHFVEEFVIPTNHLVCKGFYQIANGKYSRTKCDDGNNTPPPHIMFQKGTENINITVLPEIVLSNSNIIACNGIIHSISEVMLF